MSTFAKEFKSVLKRHLGAAEGLTSFALEQKELDMAKGAELAFYLLGMSVDNNPGVQELLLDLSKEMKEEFKRT